MVSAAHVVEFCPEMFLLRKPVIFDALQIPAGMLQLHQNPMDSRGIETFLQEWDWNSDFLSLYKVILKYIYTG